MLVHLIGPGGAGKTTTGRLLAGMTGLPFIDLDEEYLKRHSIDEDIETGGYEYYARTNVDLYIEVSGLAGTAIIALSSGFMLYSHDIHPRIEAIHEFVLASPTTVFLLPSFDLEECVQEIAKRQMSKPYIRSTVEREQKTARKRFPLYAPMGKIRVATNRPTAEVVREITLSIEGMRLT